MKLHLGCGSRLLDDWVNVDINTIEERNAKLGRVEVLKRDIDLRHNLLEPLPYQNNSVDLIYNEHLFEHFSFIDGRRMLRDWLRVLRPGGMVRIATPSIEGAIALYSDLDRFEKLNKGMNRNIQTRGIFMNQFFRSFGHRFIYDEQTLAKSLADIGFVKIATQPVSESSLSEFCNLETRLYEKNSLLTSLCIEAKKPQSDTK